MLITILSVSYLILSLISAVIFYCACAAGARLEEAQEDEIQLDQGDLDYQFNHLEWADKPNT